MIIVEWLIVTKIICDTIIIQSTVHKNNGAHNELYNSSSEHKKKLKHHNTICTQRYIHVHGKYFACVKGIWFVWIIMTESTVVKSVFREWLCFTSPCPYMKIKDNII